MNKFLSRFSTALISLSLAVGIGVSLSSEKGIIRADAGTNLVAKALFGANYNQKGISTYTSTFVATVDGFSWNVSNFNNNSNKWDYVKTGNKSAASVGTITTAKEVTDVVTSAYLKIDAITAASVNSIKLLAGADSSSLSEVGSFELSTGTQEIAIPEEVQSANYFYQFSFDCLKGSSNGIVTVSEAGLYSDVATGDTTTSLTVSPSTWTGYNTQTLNVANFTVTATTTVSGDGYVFQGIGYGTGDKFVARDATFSSGNPLTTDTRLQWKAKYPTTAGGSEYLYAGVDLTVNEDVLSSISVNGSMTKTEYYTGDNWDPTGLEVTATYASGATAPIDSSEITWTYSPEKPAVGVTSVTATASYGGQTAISSSQTVNVIAAILFDFETNFETYAAGWSNTYSNYTISSSDLSVSSIKASISITKASKQTSNISTMPVVKASTIIFTLDASESRVIDHVEVNFAQWTTRTQSINLYKGLDTTVTAISTLSFPNSGTSISASGLNSNSFTCTTNTNNQIGIKSIVVTLKDASFGTLDHISVASMPNKTLYCVDEEFVSEGLVITAYDGADELTANSKDVTATASYTLEDGYIFVESDVTDAFVAYVGYTENGVTVSTSYNILVANNSSYSLVTTEPSDWTGEYLVVTNNAGSLLGLNASLDEVDISSNFVNLTATDNTISTPSFNSIIIEKMEGGYSVKSTYTGKYYGNNIDDNGLSSDTNPILNTISLKSDGTAALVSNTRTLAFNNASNQLRFRYFKAPEAQQSIYLYRKDISTNATNFATMFLDQLTCDPTGVTPPDTEEWAILELEFADLAAYDQTEFRIASANASGNVIEQAVAKYDYIITKYGVTNYVDFMGRVEYGSLTLANNRIEFADKLDSQSTIICVVILTLLSVSTIGGYIILKKTKEN
ncbi:MAG: bacterial Ig-like domain-containing protein [Bacilli bacterium]|nr:bacterial Ig-like domain-containing protein [Bacilli bacterium]